MTPAVSTVKTAHLEFRSQSTTSTNISDPPSKTRIFVLPYWLAERREISQQAKHLYSIILFYFKTTGKVWASHTSLGEYLEKSRRSVIRYSEELEQYNLIEVQRRRFQTNLVRPVHNHPWQTGYVPTAPTARQFSLPFYVGPTAVPKVESSAKPPVPSVPICHTGTPDSVTACHTIMIMDPCERLGTNSSSACAHARDDDDENSPTVSGCSKQNTPAVGQLALVETKNVRLAERITATVEQLIAIGERAEPIRNRQGYIRYLSGQDLEILKGQLAAQVALLDAAKTTRAKQRGPGENTASESSQRWDALSPEQQQMCLSGARTELDTSGQFAHELQVYGEKYAETTVRLRAYERFAADPQPATPQDNRTGMESVLTADNPEVGSGGTENVPSAGGRLPDDFVNQETNREFNHLVNLDPTSALNCGDTQPTVGLETMARLEAEGTTSLEIAEAAPEKIPAPAWCVCPEPAEVHPECIVVPAEEIQTQLLETDYNDPQAGAEQKWNNLPDSERLRWFDQVKTNSSHLLAFASEKQWSEDVVTETLWAKTESAFVEQWVVSCTAASRGPSVPSEFLENASGSTLNARVAIEPLQGGVEACQSVEHASETVLAVFPDGFHGEEDLEWARQAEAERAWKHLSEQERKGWFERARSGLSEDIEKEKTKIGEQKVKEMIWVVAESIFAQVFDGIEVKPFW